MLNVQEEDRKFLHDLATPLTVVKTLVKRQVTELEGPASGVDPAKQLDRLKKVLEAIKQMEELHASHKERITFRKYE